MAHTQKKHVQLIDKIDIPAGVILSLWDLDKNSRISLEIEHPQTDYVVGEVFVMGAAKNTDGVKLTPSNEKIDAKTLLIPRRKTLFETTKKNVEKGVKRPVKVRNYGNIDAYLMFKGQKRERTPLLVNMMKKIASGESLKKAAASGVKLRTVAASKLTRGKKKVMRRVAGQTSQRKPHSSSRSRR